MTEDINTMSFFAKSIMEQKYSHDLEDGTKETWNNIAYRVSKHVLKDLKIGSSTVKQIKQLIEQRKFMPGGRYLYASGRPFHQTQNCLLLRAEDSREGWAELMHKSSMALMTGAGIGVDYSDIRPEGKLVRKTGGIATGPGSLMQMVNEAGRGIVQGGMRRAAIWAGLSWKHADIHKFISMKNWIPEVRALKEKDFNFPATMDFTNISVQLDDDFFKAYYDDKHPLHSQAHAVYWGTVRQMLKTGEPGFSVDTGNNSKETLRNACTEVCSETDSDICNLGSINLARIESLEEMKIAVELGTLFLLAGTVYSDTPYPLVDRVRTKNRRLGLGLMGIHEWLLVRGKKYGQDSELDEYLKIYATSGEYAKKFAKEYDLSVPVKTRAIAPTGTIGIIAETTTGIEPIFCLVPGTKILTGNLDWVNIENLKVGNDVVGFREIPLDFKSNKFNYSKILNITEIKQPVYRITTDKGIVESSSKHLWVSRKKLPESGQTRKGQGWNWITTETLKPEMEIAFTEQPWLEDVSFDGGWLSGILDGEGHLGNSASRHGVRMSVCQNEGPALNKIKNLLNERNIKYTEYSVKEKGRKLEFNKWQAYKLLGMVKPSRLIPKIKENIENTKLTNNQTAKIISVEYLGEQTVFSIETSSKTLIANGFLSHNCAAYKRRYKKGSDMNAYQYVIDPTAKKLVDKGISSDIIEDAYTLAANPEIRVAFQAHVQQFVDHGISSTINLPHWGSEQNNEGTVRKFGNMLIKYLPNLRGITVYPDGARDGQPLTPIKFSTAIKHSDEIFYESASVCDITKAGECNA